jgi:hypothetical protein
MAFVPQFMFHPGCGIYFDVGAVSHEMNYLCGSVSYSDIHSDECAHCD